VDRARGLLFGGEAARSWLGQPFLDSLLRPSEARLPLQVEMRAPHRRVLVLDCLDHLYGHALLRLLNADRHLREQPATGLGLVVLVPGFLRWLVPDGVAEVWQVDLPLSRAQAFHPHLDQQLQEQCARFDEVFLSPAWSHPRDFDITRFTGVARHAFTAEPFRVTFVWREDRPWCGLPLAVRAGNGLASVRRLLLHRQGRKVRRLLAEVGRSLPTARLTVAGLGTTTRFPGWVDDRRVAAFDEAAERALCQVYRESRLVVGVHGSSLLLPSAHAGLTIDLMPDDRWGNFAQDLLYQEPDPRLAAYRYRFLPAGTPAATLARRAVEQVRGFGYFARQMLGARDAAAATGPGDSDTVAAAEAPGGPRPGKGPGRGPEGTG
jgi:hypothetical protein